MLNCKIISGIYAVKIKNARVFENVKFCLRYIHPSEGESLLLFNGKDPGSSKPNSNFDEARKHLEIIGEPLPYLKFKDFFKEYSTDWNKRFYYVDSNRL